MSASRPESLPATPLARHSAHVSLPRPPHHDARLAPRARSRGLALLRHETPSSHVTSHEWLGVDLDVRDASF